MTGGTAEPDLRDRIAQLVGRGETPEATADAIVDLINTEGGKRCDDKDCARRWPHSRIARHLWRHAAEPPFGRTPFGWTCFSCGKCKRHRIHRRPRGRL